MVCFGVRQLFKLRGWDACLPLAENSWIGLTAWFSTQVRLYDGLQSCLDSLARLTKWLELGTTYNSRRGYELASLTW